MIAEYERGFVGKVIARNSLHVVGEAAAVLVVVAVAVVVVKVVVAADGKVVGLKRDEGEREQEVTVFVL